MRIDSHVHVWTMGAPPFVHSDAMSTARPEYPGLIEDLIRYMDLNQIDRTVLIQCMYHGYETVTCVIVCDGSRIGCTGWP